MAASGSGAGDARSRTSTGENSNNNPSLANKPSMNGMEKIHEGEDEEAGSSVLNDPSRANIATETAKKKMESSEEVANSKSSPPEDAAQDDAGWGAPKDKSSNDDGWPPAMEGQASPASANLPKDVSSPRGGDADHVEHDERRDHHGVQEEEEEDVQWVLRREEEGQEGQLADSIKPSPAKKVETDGQEGAATERGRQVDLSGDVFCGPPFSSMLCRTCSASERMAPSRTTFATPL